MRDSGHHKNLPHTHHPTVYRRKAIIGHCTLYLADCARVLPTLSRMAAVVTDPPYGIGASSGVGKYGVMKWGGVADLKWDETPPTPALLEAVLHAADHHIIWGANYLPLPPARCVLVWDKGACFRSRYFAEAELAWTSLDRPVKVFTRDPLARKDYHRGRDHPTQKPIQLLDWCLSLLPDGCDTILDPFMGSGTTGVACVRTGKAFVGIEREPHYFDAACRRITETLRRPGLFDDVSLHTATTGRVALTAPPTLRRGGQCRKTETD